MLVDYKARVNQKLYFARIHIDLLQQELTSELRPKHVVEEAIGESTVFHLIGVYLTWLKELAANYSVPAEGIQSLKDLVEGFTAQNLVTAELNELKVLEETDSWLRALLGAYYKIWQVMQELKGQSSLDSGIPIRQISESQEIDLKTCANWHEELSSLIERGRGTMYEW